MESVSTLLVDASRLFREGLQHLLSGTPFRIEGEAATIDEALAWLARNPPPQLVLVEFEEGPSEPFAQVERLRAAYAGKIVVLMGAVGNTKPEGQAAKDLEQFATPLTMKTLGEMSYAEIGRQLSALADAYDVKLPRELVLIGKQFLYVERYMKLLAPNWQMMNDPQLTGYFANFMVEVSREHNEELDT